MKFYKLDFDLQKCDEHLGATKTRNTEIESYFVQYLLIRICAEYEERIKLLVERRCSRVEDHHIKRFSKSSAEYIIRHFKVTDIKGILKRFGDDYKQAFDNSVDAQGEVAWNNIYNNRKDVAHKKDVVHMSFNDLKKNYQESLAVLDALACALGLEPEEMQGL